MIRLEGPESEVVALTHLAARVLRREDATWDELTRRLPRLRGEAVRLAREHPRISTLRRAATVAWWVALSIGLCAALAAAAMFDPPSGKNRFTDPEVSITIAVWSAVVGLVMLGAVLVVRVPGVQTPGYSAVITIVVGVVVALLIAYRLVVGTGDDRGFTADQLRQALPLAALDLVLLALLAVRLELVRRRTLDSASARHDAEWRREWLRRDAEALATLPAPSDVDVEWRRQVSRLHAARALAPTLEQAQTMSPVGWLVWAFVDADLDVSGVLRPE